MTEQHHNPEHPFAGLSDARLIRRMEQAEDFGYDDEEAELTRRLALGGLAWRWSQDWSNPRVEVYRPEAGDAEA